MTSYEHKVKNIYLGTWEQTIEVDWTTLSALPTWWTALHNTPLFNNGVYWTSSTSQANTPLSLGYRLDMNNIKKLTIENNGNRTWTWWAWWDIFWITNNSYFYNGDVYDALIHVKAYSSNAWNTNQNGIKYLKSNSWAQLTGFTTWSNVGDRNNKTEINFDTWYVKISSTAPYTYEYDTTLSATILEDIKTYTYVLLQLSPASSARSTIYNTTITIER